MGDAILIRMTHRVRIEPSGREFDVEGDDTLLEGALRAGLALDYGCGNGNCGQCRARLLAGEVRRTRHHDFTFGEAELLDGAILACAVAPASDIVIEAGEADSVTQIPQQRVTTRLLEVRTLSDELAAVSLRPPRSQRLRFLAGQHATLTAGDLPPLELGIASCPCEELRLEFHVPRLADAPLTAALLDGDLRHSTPITIDGPRGDFVLDRDSNRSLVFIAIGTGFAPVRSLVEHAQALEQAPHIHLERLPLAPHGLYLENLCRSWVDAFDDFSYTARDGPAGRDELTDFAATFANKHLGSDDCALFIAGPARFAQPLADALAEQSAQVPLRITSVGCPA
ncbi:MAG: flavodoxin oxidoreductase [Gammaproteobacteria bacterium]|nr:MAG: flavodoxin oxidoreductase [Gammaproteobacteria bacterium]